MNANETRTWAEIDLGALKHNVREIRAALPESCGLVGIVKADAYGHGAVPVARALREAGASYLAVACPEEAFQLRAAGELLPVLILGAADPAWAPRLSVENITQAVGSLEQGRALSAALLPGQRLKIHLKLDTGMGRLGFPAREETAFREAAAVMALPGLETEGVFTHFAVSDTPGGEDYTRGQYAAFTAAVAAIETLSGRKIPLRHCMNSGAVLGFRELGAETQLCRPGLLIYGVYPEREHFGLELRPVMTLKTRILAVTNHRAGDSISYGRTWRAERDSRLAVIPVGYADGLHRALSGKLQVGLRGRRVPQVGRICMDMCMLDVTDMPQTQCGDVVTVFGQGQDGGPTVEELADLAGTIPYELMCAVSLRVPRIYK
ncbi:MAG: alanine racemase [Oscillospiraceae bacterium]|nr:alanine racemase [Oscillospiraceae bacterium]